MAEVNNNDHSKKNAITPEYIIKASAYVLGVLRDKKPVVEMMTNYVAARYSAQVLLSSGAQPSPVSELGEASALVSSVDALLVNVGTLTKDQADAMRAAVTHSNAAQKPWILDPINVGALPLRTFLCREIMKRCPSVIRAKTSEAAVLAGDEQLPADRDAIIEVGKRISKDTRAAILLTADDADYIVYDNAPTTVVRNGNPIMEYVSGLGCAQGALAAAILGVLRNHRYEAAATTAVIYGVAGEIAAAKCKTPGSFSIEFLDTLYSLTPEQLKKYAKVEVIA